MDQHGRLIDFRSTARRDAKAARAFFRRACDDARLVHLPTIVTDKARSCAKVIGEMSRLSFPGKEILHVDRNGRNNRIERDHAALMKLINPTRGFKPPSAAKGALKGVVAVRGITRDHFIRIGPGVAGEVRFATSLYVETS